MTQMGATRQLEAVRRTGYASSRGWLARVFWPKVSTRGRHLTKAKVESMQRLYGHDPELHHLMTAVTLLRDETAVLRQEMEVYAESGPELSAKAGEAYAEELQALGRRATDKGVLLPEEPSAAADMLGDVLSIEDLVADLGIAEERAADVGRRFAEDVVDELKRVHDEMERVFNVRIKPARDAHELAWDAFQKPEHRLQKLLEHSEEELSSPRNQRKLEEGEIDSERLQAQLKVTTVRLKEKTSEFLRSYTPLVFDAIKEYVVRQQQMLQECSAAFAGLTDAHLGGMRVVRAKRVDIEHEDLKQKMAQTSKVIEREVYIEREE